MRYGISEIAFIPIRQGMSDRSEMLSQILFGECFIIQTHRDDWMRIKMLNDNYEGWIPSEAVTVIDEEQFKNYETNKVLFFSELQTVLIKNNNQKIQIPIGSTMPYFDAESKSFRINDNTYALEEELKNDDSQLSQSEKIISLAKKMLNTPYLWGGRTSWGIDCSGFTQMLYRYAGIEIPRDSGEQVNIGNTINFLSDAQIGDLIFFDSEDGSIVHVGVFLGNGKIIHASKKVRIDIIDHQGIYNREIKRYSHNLRVIKSILL